MLQSLLGDEDALSLAMDDNDTDAADDFGSGYRGFSVQSSSIRDGFTNSFEKFFF